MIKKMCKDGCVGLLRRRLPVTAWLPSYRVAEYLPQDCIAGITVGLTMVGQAIAYATIAGLTPDYGLYSALLGGFVYLLLGTTKEVCIGPTAIMSALLAPYVADYTAEFAVFAAFVTGVIVLAMGVLQLGFIIEFISGPVIAGFTFVGALQIATSQFKGFFGLDGSSGNYVLESIVNAIENASTVKLWDPVLGVFTLMLLYALQYLGKGCSRVDAVSRQVRWFLSLSRNTIVIIVGIIVAYVVKVVTGQEPLVLTGEITGGLPQLDLPPFSLTVNNQTLGFFDMVSGLSVGNIMLPLIAVLEAVAIAKAFTVGKSLDGTQEMIAVGFCNLLGSFVGSVPVTASFTRAALNNASGVCTPLGGIFTGLIIILTLNLLTSTFYYIPKSTLSALIIAAMVSLMDVTAARKMWRCGKREFATYTITVLVSALVGLEYGIMAGVALDAMLLLYRNARPTVSSAAVGSGVLAVYLPERCSYCAADHIRRCVQSASEAPVTVVAIDGGSLLSLDSTVATNLAGVARDLRTNNKIVKFVNFKPSLQNLISINAAGLNTEDLFVNTTDISTCFQKIDKSG